MPAQTGAAPVALDPHEPHSLRGLVIQMLGAEITALRDDPDAARLRPFAETVLTRTIEQLRSDVAVYSIADLEPADDATFRTSVVFRTMAEQLGYAPDDLAAMAPEDRPFEGRVVPADEGPRMVAFPRSGVLAITDYPSRSILMMPHWHDSHYHDQFAGDVNPLRMAPRRIVHEVNHAVHNPISTALPREERLYRHFVAEWRAYLVEQMTLPDPDARELLAGPGLRDWQFRNYVVQNHIFGRVLDASEPRAGEPYPELRYTYYTDRPFRLRINNLLQMAWNEFVHAIGGSMHNGPPADSITQFAIQSYVPPEQLRGDPIDHSR